MPCELRLREHSWDRTGFRACRLRMNAFFAKHPGSAQSIPAPPSGCGSSIENLVSSPGLWLLPEVIRHLPCIVVLPQSILSPNYPPKSLQNQPQDHPDSSPRTTQAPPLLWLHLGPLRPLPQAQAPPLGSGSTPGPPRPLPQALAPPSDHPGSSPRFWLYPRTTKAPPLEVPRPGRLQMWSRCAEPSSRCGKSQPSASHPETQNAGWVTGT